MAPSKSAAQHSPLSATQATQPSFPSFSSLPLELRETIWDMTLEPRTLSIYIHEGWSPATSSHSSAALPFFHSQPTKVVCAVLTAILGILPRFQSPYTNADEYRKLPWRGYFALEPHMKHPPPPGPAALYVCRESRRVARRRYELAFGGTNLVPRDEMFVTEWENGGYGWKKTWVDFERDVIFIAGADLSVSSMPMRIGVPVMEVGLERFVLYAKEEVGKIRNLGVGGMWADVRTWGRQSNRFAVTMDVVVREFAMLKSLAVYHYDLMAMNVNGQYGMADPQVIRKDITDYVGKKARERAGYQELELPVVTVYKNMVRVSPNGDT